MPRADLERIAQLAVLHDLWVVSDEVYADLTFEREHVSIASLNGMAERTVTLGSLSKSHAMPGWRVGWAIGPKTLMEHLGRLALCMLYGLPGFVQQAALTAIENKAQIVADMREIYRRRRDLVFARLSQVPGLRCLLPEAGMFMMVDITGTGLIPSISRGSFSAPRASRYSMQARSARPPMGMYGWGLWSTRNALPRRVIALPRLLRG